MSHLLYLKVLLTQFTFCGKNLLGLDLEILNSRMVATLVKIKSSKDCNSFLRPVKI